MAEVLDDLLLQSFDLLVCVLPLRHDDRVGNGHFLKVAGLNISTKSSAASNNMETLVSLKVEALKFLHHLDVRVQLAVIPSRHLDCVDVPFGQYAPLP